MDEDSALKVGVVALVFSILAIGFAITASKIRITDNLDMDNYYIYNTNIVQKHIRIPASNLGRNPTDPPTIDVYGICHVAEFVVGSDKAHYKINVPPDMAGTTARIHFHWTRSTTGSDESGKMVNWQVKYLSITEGENVHIGELTENVEDTYEDTDTTGKIVCISDYVTLVDLVIDDLLIMEFSAISSSGTDLSKPALLEFCIDYDAYQVQPPPQGD